MTDSAGTLCISPLCQQAAGNMYVMEWMVGQAGWWTERRIAFWLTYRMLAATADEQAAWLPTIAMAIRAEKNYQILSLLADWELPEPVPPEAKPWEHWLSGWKLEPAIMADWGKQWHSGSGCGWTGRRNIYRSGSGKPAGQSRTVARNSQLNLPRLKPEDSGSCYAAACAAVSRTQFRAGSCSPPAGA
jgi:hypothetical protein